MTEEIARVEYKLHCQAIREACWHLGQDRFSWGYRCLHTGLERVCESAEEPWAEDLARSYRDALFYYASLNPGGSPPRRRGADRG